MTSDRVCRIMMNDDDLFDLERKEKWRDAPAIPRRKTQAFNTIQITKRLMMVGKNSKNTLKSRLLIVLKRKVLVNKTRHSFSLM